MATPKYNTYVGMRYVPIFDGEWDRTKTYEPLTIVSYQGNSYTSRTFIPVGMDINNTEYWALTGNYNAQVEYYRQETARVAEEVNGCVHYYTTVDDMKNDTAIEEDFIIKTGGYYSYDDGGGSYYKIVDEEPTSYYEELDNGLYAILLPYDNTIAPEQFGAVGDNTTDDYTAILNAINYAIANDKIVKFNTTKTFLINSQLTIPENCSFIGCTDSYGNNTKLKASNGLKIAGRHIALKNFTITGNDSGYGLYCCGNDEGGEVAGANHFSMNVIENLVIEHYAYGLHFNAVVWENVFSKIRFNFCETGINNTSTYNMMTTRFENIYISGSHTKNINLNKASVTFLNCNFGLSVAAAIGFYQNCNIVMIGCNFECDTYLTGPGAILEITGNTIIIDGCNFYATTASNVNFINTGALVTSAIFRNFVYHSVDIGEDTNQFAKFLSDSITAAVVGAIKFVGCTVPDFIHNDNTRLPYGKMQFCIDDTGIIKVYNSEYIDASKSKMGDMVYYIQTKQVCAFDGTAYVQI